MRLCAYFRKPGYSFQAAAIRSLLGLFLIVTLVSCASEGARNAELAAQEVARITAEQEAASLAQEQARARAAELLDQRREETAAQARQQAQREQQAQAVAEQARAEEERRQQEEAERREQERLAAIAAAAAVRQEKLDKITALEQQIAAIRAETSDDDAGIDLLQQAILVAEELLEVLDTEQAKYDDTDADGNTVQSLAKDLIAEVEARKDALLSQIDSQ